MQRESVTITTDASGDATGYITAPAGGALLHALHYVKNNYDNGVDFVITEEDTGQAILTTSATNASESFYPRRATVGITNAAALYAAGGTAVNERASVRNRIKIVVAQGGNAKLGTFYADFAEG